MSHKDGREVELEAELDFLLEEQHTHSLWQMHRTAQS